MMGRAGNWSQAAPVMVEAIKARYKAYGDEEVTTRALLRFLGYDPETHDAFTVRWNGRQPGIRIVKNGLPGRWTEGKWKSAVPPAPVTFIKRERLAFMLKFGSHIMDEIMEEESRRAGILLDEPAKSR